MRIEVALSGKVGKKGREQQGLPDDENLAQRLYGHAQREADVASRLEVVIRPIGNKVYTYYTYMKPRDVAQFATEEDNERGWHHGREGSFLALTVRFEQMYCSDVEYLYRLLADMYGRYLYGKVVTDKNTDGFLTYTIKQLSEAENQLREIDGAIQADEKLKRMLVILPNDVVAKARVESFEKINLADVDNKTALQKLFGGTELYVSAEYTSIADVAVRKKKADEYNKKEDEANEWKRKYNEAKTKNKELTDQIMALNNKVVTLKETVADSGSINDTISHLIIAVQDNTSVQYKILQHLQDVFDEHSRLNNQIKSLAKELPLIDESVDMSTTREKDWEKATTKQWDWRLIAAITFFFMFVLGLIIALRPNSSLPYQEPIEDIVVEKAEETNYHNEEHLTDEPTDSEGPKVTEYEQGEITWLDLNGKQPLRKNLTYEVTALVGKQGHRMSAQGNGTFSCSVDGVLLEQDGALCRLTITDDCRERTVVLKYMYFFDNNEMTYEREFSVK